MFNLLRALIYASGFVAAILLFVPARILAGTGLTRAPTLGVPELLVVAVAVAGALLAGWSIVTFAFVGKGTAAPFDPPRRLVVSGPYRYVRNPIYIGAGLGLGAAAFIYRSLALLGYLALLAVVIQALVVWYEEPTLRRTFGAEYAAYCRRVHRWLPRRPAESGGGES